MDSTGEATINPDGTATFETPPEESAEDTTFNAEEDAGNGDEFFEQENIEEAVKGIDPAIYLILVVVAALLIWFFFFRSKKDESDMFFSELDGEKVSERG
jgi:hypothetical protein